jgi:hypothetical protein
MRNTLLVEGVDDQEVARQLLRPHGYEIDPEDREKLLRHARFGQLDVRKTGGYPTILEELSVIIKSRGGFHIGIVLDRDMDADEQKDPWPSIRRRIVETLPELDAALPKDHDPLPKQGLITSTRTGRRLGVWLMPDNQSLGMLETFVSSLIPSTDRLWPQAQSAVDSIPSEDRLFRHKIDKACIHTWLAWQQDPGEKMGSAINKRYLDPQSPSAVAFVHWLQALIAPPPQ